MSETTTKKNVKLPVLSPTKIPILSKENALAFHAKAVATIYETGNGLFEYVETINFMAALKDCVSKDAEFIDHLRTQIKYNGDKNDFKTSRGVKFEIAETGTTYDYSQCNDDILFNLERQLDALKVEVAERQKFLKAIPAKGLEVMQEGGEVITLYPPSKSSKSSFKVTLPK
jgi:hypothetical protein